MMAWEPDTVDQSMLCLTTDRQRQVLEYKVNVLHRTVVRNYVKPCQLA